MVLYNNRDPTLEGGHSKKIGGVWNLKHETSSSKFYEILIKKELKVSDALYLKNLYNHIKMYLNAVTILLKYLLHY